MSEELSIILGLTGAGGLFGLMLKIVPYVLEWLRDRKAGSMTLTDTAFRASGMTLESLMAVIDKLERMVAAIEVRISKMREEYAEDIAILRNRYETELALLVERHGKRSDELLDEIKTLKVELAKYRSIKKVKR